MMIHSSEKRNRQLAFERQNSFNLSFIGIQKFVFLFARLWEITP